MNGVRRIGGWSAILHGIAVLVAFGLFVPTFTAMPAEAMEPENYAARLAAFGSFEPARRTALALGFGLQLVAGLMVFPALLVVHRETRARSEGPAALALGLAALGVPFVVLSVTSSFALLEVSYGFGSAGEIGQMARSAIYQASEATGLLLEKVSWLLFGWSTVLWFGLTRGTFAPRWVPWVGLVAGLAGLSGTVGSVFVPGVEAALPLAQLLLAGWFGGLGLGILRSSRNPG